MKGGGVGRDANGWYSIDRSGVRNRIKDPGQQATEAVHSIDRYLSALRWFRDNRVRVPFGWGVVFPDVDAAEELGPDFPSGVVIDRQGIREIRSSIDRIFATWVPAPSPIREDVLRALVRTLAPSFQLVAALVSRIEEESEMLLRLTDEQMEVLDLLESFHRVAIEGPAGSGKTLLAMEKARRLAEKGKRVLFLCFNRPLADHLAPRADGFTVKSFHAYCREVAESAAIPFRIPRNAAEEERFWAETAAEKLVEALDLYPDERFDAVIVDEGQDFREYWWIAVEKLLRDPKR
ncbi:MAG: DEAD/DEAH box helicase family protein, partial [Candidatus Binatia bacterium]